MQDKTPLIIGFDGTTMDASLEAHLLTINPAGILLFKRNIINLNQTQKLISDIKKLLGDIIISIDHEGGIVSRFPENIPVSPSPRALYHFSDARQKAVKIQAEVLSYVGINLNFAPVVDLYGNKDSQVIGIRAFSEDPEEVVQYARECISAHEHIHIGTTAKHFPGHGSTSTDSHYATGTVGRTQSEIRGKELLSFRKAIEAGVPAIMTAHLKYPALDPDLPASISKPILNDLLRKELGFSGLIITDCIEMAGLSKIHTPDEIIEKGLEAGVDLWISSFSFNKDKAFQIKLKEKLDALKRHRDFRQHFHNQNQRIEIFLKKYPSRKTNHMPSITEGVQLSRECFGKFKETDQFPHQSGFYLIELTSQDFSGLNSSQEMGTTAQFLNKKCRFVLKGSSLSIDQIKELEKIMEQCIHEKLTPLLLTRNSFRHRNYERLMNRITSNLACFHIALLDDLDITTKAAMEWCTWGENHTVSQALLEELNQVGANYFKDINP